MANDCVKAILKAMPEEEKKYIGIDGSESDAEVAKIMGDKIESASLEQINAAKTGLAVKNMRMNMRAAASILRKENVTVPEVETAMSMLTDSRRMGKAAPGFTSLEGDIFTVRLGYESMLNEFMEANKATKLGFGKSNLAVENFLRYAIDGNGKSLLKADPDAAAYAKAWKKVTDAIREDFNALGGDIKKLEDFVIPQAHDVSKMVQHGKGVWLKSATKNLNKERIMKMDSLNLKTDDDYKDFLHAVYDNLVDDGFKPTPDMGNLKLRRAVSKLHQESRLMHFKNADAYMDYSKNFGRTNNHYESMMGYLDRMSREIAAMHKFGPNPDYVVGQMIATARNALKRAHIANRDKGIKGIPRKLKLYGKEIVALEDVYSDLMGRNMTNRNALASSMQVARNLEYASKLGFAAISATTDSAFMAIAAKTSNIPVLKMYKRFSKNLVTANMEDKRFLLKIGMMSDYVATRANQTFRFGESTGSGLTANLVNATIKLSGLEHWTITAKNAFSMEFLNTMSELTAKSFDKLPPRLRASFERYGLNVDDWAAIAKAEPEIHQGVKFINPQNLPMTIRQKIVGMIHSETQFAVPEPNARVRAGIHRGTKGGTVTGELMRMFGQLKTFPLTIMSSHWARATNIQGGANKLKYFGSLAAGTMATGMVAQWAYDAAKGKTPRSVTNPGFLKDAFDRGGLPGMFGDFVNSSDRKYGLPGFMGGPLLQTAADVTDLMFGNYETVKLLEKNYLSKLMDSKVPQALKLAQNHVPGSIWQIRLIMERMLYDNINAFADDEYKSKKQRLETRYKNRGQEYWWKPTGT